jgi:ComF family protein
MQAVRTSLSHLGRAALAVLFPAGCLVCNIRLQQDAALCPACWSRLHLVERPYCDVLGTPFASAESDGTVSPAAIASPPAFAHARSAVLFDDVARQLVHGLKYRDRADLALPMARWMMRASDGFLERADAVVPVPLHRWRLLARRYNQSAELARVVARLSERPFLAGALVRRKRTRRQVGLGERARQENVRGAFIVPQQARAEILGKRIVLIDDVYTTGATVNAAARALLRAGAGEVNVLTFALVRPEHLDGHADLAIAEG